MFGRFVYLEKNQRIENVDTTKQKDSIKNVGKRPEANKIMEEQSKENKPTGNTMKIDRGGKGIQNNAPNYGNQHVGDININKDFELSEAQIQEITNGVRDKITSKDKPIQFWFSIGHTCAKIHVQLHNRLDSLGYKVEKDTGIEAVQRDKIQFEQLDNVFLIHLGTFTN